MRVLVKCLCQSDHSFTGQSKVLAELNLCANTTKQKSNKRQQENSWKRLPKCLDLIHLENKESVLSPNPAYGRKK